jgi:hypothetical protein
MSNKAEVYRKAWIEYKSFAEEGHAVHVRRANDIIRQLALAGIAVVWVLRETTAAGKIMLAAELRWAAGLLILTLALDLLHYLIGAFQFSSRLDDIEHQENEALRNGNEWPNSPTGLPPPAPEMIGKSLFCAKAVAVIVGSGLLLFYLAFRV